MTGPLSNHSVIQLVAQFSMDCLAVGIPAEDVLELLEGFDPITSQERPDEIVAAWFAEPRRGSGRDDEDGPQRRFLVLGS